MEQELRFGLDLGRLALLKKRVWADYEQLLRVVFFMFSVAKKIWDGYEQLFRTVFSSFHGQKE